MKIYKTQSEVEVDIKDGVFTITDQDAKDAEKWWGCKNYLVALGKFCEPKPKITRVEVIDRTKQADEGGGRVYTNYDVNDAWVSYQDNKRTLKLFINESEE